MDIKNNQIKKYKIKIDEIINLFLFFVIKEKNKHKYINIGTLEIPELILPNKFP